MLSYADERTYASVLTATGLIATIVYGLLRSCNSGVLILFSWWPKVIYREEVPVQYWCWFIFYALLIPLIIALASGSIRELIHP